VMTADEQAALDQLRAKPRRVVVTDAPPRNPRGTATDQ